MIWKGTLFRFTVPSLSDMKIYISLEHDFFAQQVHKFTFFVTIVSALIPSLDNTLVQRTLYQ